MHDEKDRWALGRAFAKGLSRPLWWSFLGCLLVALVLGAWFFGRAYSIADARGELGVSGDASGGVPMGANSPWAVQTTTDPMTDATISQASATFEGNQFNVEIGVSCSSTGDIGYTATSFSKAGEPAEMRTEANWQRSWIPFQMRADDNQPLSWSTSNPQYNNQISLNSEPVHFYMGKPLDDRAEGMASASKIVLRLFMPTGEEAIEWSQADAALRSLLAPCLSQRQAERDRLAAEQASKEREEAAERARAPVQSVDAM